MADRALHYTTAELGKPSFTQHVPGIGGTAVTNILTKEMSLFLHYFYANTESEWHGELSFQLSSVSKHKTKAKF